MCRCIAIMLGVAFQAFCFLLCNLLFTYLFSDMLRHSDEDKSRIPGLLLSDLKSFVHLPVFPDVSLHGDEGRSRVPGLLFSTLL